MKKRQIRRQGSLKGGIEKIFSTVYWGDRLVFSPKNAWVRPCFGMTVHPKNQSAFNPGY